MSQDLFTAPDYYQLDSLLTEEHLLVRDQSFGKGNFKALFEAIEREQAVRGTL